MVVGKKKPMFTKDALLVELTEEEKNTYITIRSTIAKSYTLFTVKVLDGFEVYFFLPVVLGFETQSIFSSK